ncbi:hypothetical protein [Novosphingobium sp. BL-52-GroH]|uniref:hypothetical protein n=1 Tax=Novosphingobium sp. BL-52-GroH TaxID=3349877 RepID=UPI003850533D
MESPTVHDSQQDSPHHRRARLDEGTCRLICPIASAMVGVCMTGIGLLRVAIVVRGGETVADDLLSADALAFLLATLCSYFALRVQSFTRLHWLERVADGAFIAAMLMLTMACFVITYSLGS